MKQSIATILITAPMKRADPTEYTYEWALEMERIAKNLGYKVITLKGEDVNYDNVTSLIQKYNPRLYVHTGHGCASFLSGQRECILTKRFTIEELLRMDTENLSKMLEPVKTSCPGICKIQNELCLPFCQLPTNIQLLKGSIIFTTSCHSASQLGPQAIQHGVQSYIGYSDLLLFPVDSLKSQDLFKDVQVKMFESILTGKSVKEANREMKRLEDAYIRLYKPIKYISLPMIWNKLNRKILGDVDARIYE